MNITKTSTSTSTYPLIKGVFATISIDSSDAQKVILQQYKINIHYFDSDLITKLKCGALKKS
jgi:hypothetical protein